MYWPSWLVLGAVVLVVPGVVICPTSGALAGDVKRVITVAQARPPGPPAPNPAPGGPAKSALPPQGLDPASAGTLPNGPAAPAGEGAAGLLAPYSYDPSGRRDPFNALLRQGKDEGSKDETLPPLQRIALPEIGLIGIIWGGFGYTAMVQTPDGKGYAVRRGTRIGSNNGVIKKITENGIFVTERFTDIYGREQERDYIKLLHPSEDSE